VLFITISTTTAAASFLFSEQQPLPLDQLVVAPNGVGVLARQLQA